jgi:hypothetical protein
MLSKLILEVLTLSVNVALVCLVPLNRCWIVILQSIHFFNHIHNYVFFCEENFPLFWKKALCGGKKKELNMPYLNHRLLYVSMVWKKINLVNDLPVDNYEIHLPNKIKKNET